MSGTDTGHEYDLVAVTEGNPAAIATIPNGSELNDLVEAVIARDVERIDAVRAAVVDTLGERGMLDAVATIAAFDAYPRIADATGIPLEDSKREATAGLRSELGLNVLDLSHN